MLCPDLPIQTSRLVLRGYRPEDAEALHDIRSRDDVARYLLGSTWDRDTTRTRLTELMNRTALLREGDFLQLAVERRDTGELIGEVLLVWLSTQHRQGEIGFVFHPDHNGHGYATEAAEVVLRLGFEEHGLHRVIGRCEARNTASAALLRRLGMRLEAHFQQNQWLKDEWNDEQVYALLASEWSAHS